MTSSLVGSEMCIRDSPNNYQSHEILRQQYRKGYVWERSRLSSSGVERAVSYTHLTLPTICSV
eukprot:3200625-Prorocentrum_lima.AAC.1